MQFDDKQTTDDQRHQLSNSRFIHCCDAGRIKPTH